MQTLYDMKVGKVRLDIDVYNVIERIPTTIKKAKEYKALIVKTGYESVDGKVAMVLYWHIIEGRKKGQRAKVVPLRRVK